MFAVLKNLFSKSSREIRDLLPELEETLLAADVGPKATNELIEALKQNKNLKTGEEGLSFLKSEIRKMVDLVGAGEPRPYNGQPSVIFFIGVNGVGKTTSMGKLAALWASQNSKILMVAGDTFRAAAGDQLKIWAERAGADFVGGKPGADSASLVFDGIRAAQARGLDLVLVDTAGRLHTKVPLMDELKKMTTVAEKALGHPVDDIFLVLDATVGQNGLSQARDFLKILPVSGIVLTKYDGPARGGIVISIVAETKIPIRFLGVGEQTGDVRNFDAREFVEGLF